MSPDDYPLTLTLPSDLGLVSSARSFVQCACQAGGLDQAGTDALVLAVNEAINNVIRHAHQDRPGAHVQLQCYVKEGAVEIHVLDEGDPFDLEQVPHLDPKEERIGGRGVFLMRALTDELTCQPRGERGNILRLVKRCPADPAASQPG